MVLGPTTQITAPMIHELANRSLSTAVVGEGIFAVGGQVAVVYRGELMVDVALGVTGSGREWIRSKKPPHKLDVPKQARSQVQCAVARGSAGALRDCGC